jgi:hypothetical protein
MKLFNEEIPLRLNGFEQGTFESFGNYFKHKALQLIAITLICFALFYLSHFLDKGIDKLRSIAPTALKQLNSDD